MSKAGVLHGWTINEKADIRKVGTNVVVIDKYGEICQKYEEIKEESNA